MIYIYIFFISAVVGICIRVIYKSIAFNKIINSSLVDSKKIVERERYKVGISTAIVILLVIIRAYIFFELNNQYGSLGNRLVGIVILCGFIPLIYYGVHVLFGTIHIGKDIAVDLQNFSLYLRPFELDNNHKSKWLEKKMCKCFNNFCKLYAIGNPNTILPPIGAETIYATNNSWKEVVHILMKKSKMIILRLGSSEGSMWELEQCIINHFHYKTIFIVTGVSEVDLIRRKMGKEGKLLEGIAAIDSTGAIYYNANEKQWQYISIQTSQDIKLLCELFKKSCHEYAILYQQFKGRKKNLLYNIRHSEQIPESIKESKFDIGFILNPVMYMFVNGWNWKLWIVPMICYISIFVLYFNDYILLSCVAAILLLCLGRYAPKISWLSRVWPDIRTFNRENGEARYLMINYLAIYVIFVLIMYVFIGFVSYCSK